MHGSQTRHSQVLSRSRISNRLYKAFFVPSLPFLQVSRGFLALWYFIDVHTSGSGATCNLNSTFAQFTNYSHSVNCLSPSTRTSLAVSLSRFAENLDGKLGGLTELPDEAVSLVQRTLALWTRVHTVMNDSAAVSSVMGGGTIWTPATRYCALAAALSACGPSTPGMLYDSAVDIAAYCLTLVLRPLFPGIVGGLAISHAPHALLAALDFALTPETIERSLCLDASARALCRLASLYTHTLGTLVRSSVVAARIVLRRFPVSQALHLAHAYFLRGSHVDNEHCTEIALSFAVFLVQRRHATHVPPEDSASEISDANSLSITEHPHSGELSNADLQLLLRMPRPLDDQPFAKSAAHSWLLLLHFANASALHRSTLRASINLNEIIALLLCTSSPALQRTGNQLLARLVLDEPEDAEVAATVDALLLSQAQSLCTSLCTLLCMHSSLIKCGQLRLVHTACRLVARIGDAAEQDEASRSSIGHMVAVSGVLSHVVATAAALSTALSIDAAPASGLLSDTSPTAPKRWFSLNGVRLGSLTRKHSDMSDTRDADEVDEVDDNDVNKSPNDDQIPVAATHFALDSSSDESDTDTVTPTDLKFDHANSTALPHASDTNRIRNYRLLMFAALDAAQRIMALADDFDSVHFHSTSVEFLLDLIDNDDLAVSEPACILLLQLCSRVRVGSAANSSCASGAHEIVDRLVRAGFVSRVSRAIELWLSAERRLRSFSSSRSTSLDERTHVIDFTARHRTADSALTTSIAAAALTRHVLLGLHVLSSALGM